MSKKQFEQIRSIETNSTKHIQFDIASILRDAVGSDFWKDKKAFWTALSGACSQYSKDIYSKINSLTKDVVDVDYCTAHSLKSLAASVGAQNLTDFIVDNYPKDLQKLIDLFSVSQNLIMKDDKLLSDYALKDIYGSIDQRTTDVYPLDTGYSQLLFTDILQNLDEIRYLLETVNGLNFKHSIWQYSGVKNRDIEFVSLSGYLNNNFQKFSAPTLNKIFDELQYIKNQFTKDYDAVYLNSLQNQTIPSGSNIKLAQNTFDLSKYNFMYQRTYSNLYTNEATKFTLSKQNIINKCTKVYQIKDINSLSAYIMQNDKFETKSDILNDVVFAWNPYPIEILNNINSYNLVNDLNIDQNTYFLNPFIALISIIKNQLFNKNTGKQLQLSYLDKETNNTIDLSLLLLNACQTIKNNSNTFYHQMLVYHFYGLFYDMLLNDYLRNEWNVYTEENTVKEIYIGNYSEYTKEQFQKKLPASLKISSLQEFYSHKPTYFNQYHVDFLTYLNIINNLLTTQEDDTKEFSYVITYYNNNFNISDIKNSIYNSEKCRLLGFTSNISYIKTIDDTPSQQENLILDIDKSVLYNIARKFADYCVQIRYARQSLKATIQQYSRIGTTQIIQSVIKDYFYKQFSNRKEWNLCKKYDQTSYLSGYNLFNSINDLQNKKNKFDIQLIEYYDKTNYLNIYAEQPKELYGYKSGKSTVSSVEVSGVTPSSYYYTYELPYPVLSTALSKSYVFDDSNSMYIVSAMTQPDFDTIVNLVEPIKTYCPNIAAVSTIVLTYYNLQTNISAPLSTKYVYCNYYNTNGYNSIEGSGNWTLSQQLPPTSSLVYYNLSAVQNLSAYNISSPNTIISTAIQFISDDLFLSDIYDTNSDQYNNLIEENNLNGQNVYLSSLICDYNTLIIPAGTIVGKLTSSEISYTYNILSTSVEKIPLYKSKEVSSFYNYRFWETNNLSDSVSAQFVNQCNFWQKYFPEIKEAQTTQQKLKIYKNQVFPFLSSVMDMNSVSGFSGELSSIQKVYAGDSTGQNQTKNIGNGYYPTIAGVQYPANLIAKQDITTENNLYINLYLNSFYTNLVQYSQNLLDSILNSTEQTSQQMFSIPASGWYQKYTSFTGYNSVYGQCSNINQNTSVANKFISVDGPWVYTLLQNFIKLYYNSPIVNLNTDNWPSLNQGLILDDSISLYAQKTGEGSKFQLSYDTIYNYIDLNYPSFRTEEQKIYITQLLFIYQHKIIQKQYSRIYDYKEDMFGNSITLFKYYKFNKYQDAGQLWIRLKNTGLSVPLMFCRQISDDQQYTYDIQDVLICKEHNKYANILKQLCNNAVQFNVFNNCIWILGYTNYIKVKNTLMKQDMIYLKLCVFKYTYDSLLNKYVVDLNSIKFINEDYNVDYFKNINEFVGAYNNYNSQEIDFIVYKMSEINQDLTDKYKKYISSNTNNYAIDSYVNLNNLDLLFGKYSYNINTCQLSQQTQITMSNAKYPIAGLFSQNQLVNFTKFNQDKFSNVSSVMQNFIGYTISLYNDDNTGNNVFETRKNYLAKAKIQYNSNYNCVDIIFNKEKYTNTQLQEFHKNCDSSKRNIVSIYNNDILNFSNEDFLFNNDFNSFFKFKSENNSSYYFKLNPYMNCQCQDNLFAENWRDIVWDKISTILEQNEITNIKLQKSKLVSKGFLSDQIPVTSYIENFSSISEGHIYVELLNYDNSRYTDTYVLYCLKSENNTVSVCRFQLCQRQLYHKNNCVYNTLIKQQAQHIWKPNLNNQNFYIAYEAINPSVVNPAIFYKNLYYSELNDLYIDVIKIQASIIKRKLNDDLYGNLIKDISIKFDTQRIDLPFQFEQLSANIWPEGSYQITQTSATILNNTNIDWCYTYGNEFNKIHNSYPKCYVSGNKLIVETILTKLGGTKDFPQNITNNGKSLWFIANYIYNSSIRKKIYSQNSNIQNTSDIYKLYKELQVVKSKYCIADYLFGLNQLKLFGGDEFIGYQFDDGFNDLSILFRTSGLSNNSINIGSLNYKEYLEKTQYYKEEVFDKIMKLISKNSNYGRDDIISGQISNYITNVDINGIQNYLDNKTDIISALLENNKLSIMQISSGAFNYQETRVISSDLSSFYPLTNTTNKIKALIPSNTTSAFIERNLGLSGKITTQQLEDIFFDRLSYVTRFISCYNFYDVGFKYDFTNYINNSKTEYNEDDFSNQLSIIKAVPSFISYFNDSLKICVSFGQLSNEVQKFITGSETFDLDISVYIDDQNINGTQHLKKVGWHCGYITTDYINWVTNDNKFGGPQIVEVNLQKYSNYLYGKYVSSYEYNNLSKYQYELYNSIAKDVKIHIEVCWHNESEIISLSPYIQLYWKGMYQKIQVDRTDLVRNNKCCENSWGYDICVDLTKNIFKYDVENKLYPVYSTTISKNTFYSINYTNTNNTTKVWGNFNRLLSDDDTNIQPLSSIYDMSLTRLLKNYNNYSITSEQMYNFCMSGITGTSFSSIIDKNISMLQASLNSEDFLSFWIQMGLNCNVDFTYNILSTAVSSVPTSNKLYSFISNGNKSDLIYNIIAQKYNANLDGFATQIFKLYSTSTVAGKKQFMAKYFKFVTNVTDIYNVLSLFNSTILKDYKFSISSNIQYIPQKFQQYYTTIEDINTKLDELADHYYLNPLTLSLSEEGLPASLKAQKVDYVQYDVEYTTIDNRKTSGYLTLIQNRADCIRRSTIITDLNKVYNTEYNISMYKSNYNQIDYYSQKYLEECLKLQNTITLNNEIISNYSDVDIYLTNEGSLVNLYSSLKVYTPDPKAVITPYIDVNVKNRRYLFSKDLNFYKNIWQDSFVDLIKRYKKSGLIMDMPLQYNNVKYNVLTNNYSINFVNNITDFYFNTQTTKFLKLLNTNEFKINSQILTCQYGSSYILYPEFTDVYLDLGYTFNINLLSSNNQLVPIYSVGTTLYQPRSIQISDYITSTPETRYTSAISAKYLNYYDSIINTSSILIEQTDKYTGILKLDVNPYYISKFIKRYLDSNSIYISNYKKLFKIDLPSSTYDKSVGKTIISGNVIQLTDVNFENNNIYHQIDSLLVDQTLLSSGLYFVSNDITTNSNINLYRKGLSAIYSYEPQTFDRVPTTIGNNTLTLQDGMIPLQLQSGSKLKILSTISANYYISGTANSYSQLEQNNNLNYTISAYQAIGSNSFLIGIISGLNITKHIDIVNKYKSNKTQFIFTTNMTQQQMKSQILSENIISSYVSVKPCVININGKNYNDIDFMTASLQNNINLIIG